ncbi:MAG TPA: N-acetyltransferase [Flavobacteriales bacterium]|nr:N-acetyltransferase [Flavobacteriales bacterium]HRE74943.1 N-acetyltransferase family protein [Flavobacteriales bacterium]HRJ35582.1 N-acetyltransferase family protein [Flavobacteriales bacterium]HRJ39503.1 N-acetyltransferase family protein [Flavobacteriales bacterium]
MDFSFRNASINDLSEIVAIYNATIPGRMVTADLEPVTIESRKEWFEKHNAQTRPLWVAEKNGKIAGWLSFHSFYGRPAYSITCELAIYIHSDFRGQKLGETFLQKAIDSAPSLGVENLLGFIFAHNEPSLKLFRKFGFSEWGNLPDVARIDGKNVTLLILGKKTI